MFEVECIDLKTGKCFGKIFYSEKLKDNFVRKCRYSKKIKVINVIDWSRYYD